MTISQSRRAVSVTKAIGDIVAPDIYFFEVRVDQPVTLRKHYQRSPRQLFAFGARGFKGKPDKMHKAAVSASLIVAAMLCTVVLQAQTSTGTISGTVSDATGAIIPSATVTITNSANANARTLTANAEGLYSAPALPAGDYQVRVEMQGFSTLVRSAQVLAGSETTVNLELKLGETREVVTVEAATASINYESNTVAGSVERNTIQEMPLLTAAAFFNWVASSPVSLLTPERLLHEMLPFRFPSLGAMEIQSVRRRIQH